MLLTFSKPQFEAKIKAGIKIHTIREDKTNRWKVGMKIHFWMGNPRNNRGQVKPHQFGTGRVSNIDRITIYPALNRIDLDGITFTKFDYLDMIAIADGFENWPEMRQFFYPHNVFQGKLIYWNDLNFE